MRKTSAALSIIAASLVTGAALAAQPTTPTGVTLIEVVRELSSSQPELLWLRPGDPQGRTLFVYDRDVAGVSACAADCAKEWIPLAVVPGAKAFGDWSIIKREGGGAQWAYQNKPLYTWVKEELPGDVATTVAVLEVQNSKLAVNARPLGQLKPPADWKVARFNPVPDMSVPDGVDVRLVAAAQGLILTDHAGLTLYAFDGDAKKDGQVCASSGCNINWVPVVAPALAANVGNFTLVSRNDGTKQWAYNKKPLYRFKDDKLPGDVFGARADKRWSIVALADDFRPAKVTVESREGYGATLAVNGMTLYTGIAYEKRWGGRNLRDNYRNAYYRGKKLAGNTCVTQQCLATWKPFLAGPQDTSNGFWEVIDRPDGIRQWAYKGYALYTFTGDKQRGDMTGNDVYDIADYNDTSEDNYKRTALLVEVNGVSSVYWHIAKP